jgi:hypothetical protein
MISDKLLNMADKFEKLAQGAPMTPTHHAENAASNAGADRASVPIVRRPAARQDVQNAQSKLNKMITDGKFQTEPLSFSGVIDEKTKVALWAFKKYVAIPSLTDENVIKILNAF